MAIGEATRTAKWVRENAIADRKARMARCVTCGGYAVSNDQLAYIVGVGVGSIRKWFNRLPVRADIADKIRAAFLRVEE